MVAFLTRQTSDGTCSNFRERRETDRRHRRVADTAVSRDHS